MGLFSGLAALGGAALGYLGTRDRIRAQNKINQDNIRLSWDMWNATNEYNSPVNQMARFKAAGLNPNLIYGQMSNVPPPAYVKAEAANASGFDAIADAIKDYETMQLQHEGMEHQMKVADANVALARERNALQAKALASSEENYAKEFEDRSRLRDLEAEKYKAEIDYTKARTKEILHPHVNPLIQWIADKLSTDPNSVKDGIETLKTVGKTGMALKRKAASLLPSRYY